MRDLFSTPHTYAEFLKGTTQGFLTSVLRQTSEHRSKDALPTMDEWLKIRTGNYTFDAAKSFFEFDDPLPEGFVESSEELKELVRITGVLSALENVSNR